ncbi:MAG: 3'-5' exonuclease domain-containing protein 2 [Prevotellaceae bacterium]|nr:3'-5' exonuclease domain-containing protein 2 [Candidatus Minthosoma caballi]
MRTITNKYDKKEISTLPRALFEGRIVVIISEREANAAVEFLMKETILGIDTETRPTFKKGNSHNVALLQVSTHNTCFLFRLNRIGITDSIMNLLQDDRIVKVGLSLQDDLRVLKRRRLFTPGTFVDLQNLVKDIGIQDMSLQKIYANVFGEKIAKNQQLSNWEADSLSDAQQKYAATDAWACIKLYEEIIRLKETGDYQLLIKTEDVVPISEGY